MINYRVIVNVVSALLIFLAVSLLLPAVISVLYGENDLPAFLVTIAIVFILGATVFWLSRTRIELRPKEGFVIVTLGWLLFAGFGALPFALSGYIPSFTDAFFESMSGFTTTGASILTNIEALPHGLRFWRSLTHWLGGMGIILLSLAILPLLGLGGMQLFKAEVPGPTPDKISPRVRQSAKLLWAVYLLLTLGQIILLLVADMNLFDAVCHTFGTMATGGFSTKNSSIGFYNSATIDYIVIVFMILAGTSFTLHYRALHGKLDVYWKDPEFKLFVGIIVFAILFIVLDIWDFSASNLDGTIQHAAFQVVSIITTTGFVTTDYEQWTLTSQLLLFALMFVGGCAGSTGGGIKIIRTLVLFKLVRNELRRLIHPQAILPVRVGDIVVPREIVGNISGFFLFYIALFATGVFLMSMLGLDLPTSLGSVAATIGNIGPGLGRVGPTDNYSFIPAAGKWLLSFMMLVGRLEIYTVVILFSRSFWKK